MKELVDLLNTKGYTIASIESLTAGLFASKIAEVSGASNVLKGALVTYQTSCKEEVLHIDHEKIEKYGVISKEIAYEMVLKGKEMFQSDFVVSFTGNAGPDVMDEKPVGLVHMGIAYQDKIITYEHVFFGSRNTIRQDACEYMKNKILLLFRNY